MSSQRICERRTFCADADFEIEVSAARMNCSLACLHRWKTDGSPQRLKLTRPITSLTWRPKRRNPGKANVSFGSLADIQSAVCDVRFAQKAVINWRERLIWSERVF